MQMIVTKKDAINAIGLTILVNIAKAPVIVVANQDIEIGIVQSPER